MITKTKGILLDDENSPNTGGSVMFAAILTRIRATTPHLLPVIVSWRRI